MAARRPTDLSAQLDLDADTVDRALDELESCELLEAQPQLEHANGGSTRRELTVKMVQVGAAVAAAPMIVSIVAPSAASALTIPPGCEAGGPVSLQLRGKPSGCRNRHDALLVCCQMRRNQL